MSVFNITRNKISDGSFVGKHFSTGLKEEIAMYEQNNNTVYYNTATTMTCIKPCVYHAIKP